MAKKNSRQKTGTAGGAMRICFDRVIPCEYHPARFEALRVATGHAKSIMTAMRLAPLDPSEVIKAKMALVNLKRWENGRTLLCRFLDGSTTQKQKVEAKAHLWEQYAKIKFKFVAAGDAQIRISFSADPGSWSAVGTDALVEEYFPRYQPTMNFGWLRDDTEDKEYGRVVVHEFGHALGCIHEHQSPTEKLKWNKAAVYRVFSGPPNYWSKAEIDHNILQKYPAKGMSATAFDMESIMLYQFDAGLFTDGKPTPLNDKLSQQDKAFIAEMYPT